MQRILAIDLGIKKSGIALSDPLQIIAQPYCLIKYSANDWDYLIAELKKIIAKKKPIEYIVLGFPLSLNNSESVMSKKVIEFKKLLESQLDYQIILEDEKFSSQEASKIMSKLNLSTKNKKKSRDSLAAQIILEKHLAQKR